ncbi:MAG: restriction endonuclease subunit S [Gammaproteobacteria bacterium]|nr:restriction endonuclease subunit S [Gammaproteobacteria bacterium]MBU2286285.1 restriction endonuclease subunit S [Gammaproteobacteria bacterium]
MNPTVRIPKHLTGKDAVSFIAMGDVSESGHWTFRQARSLKSVTAGFTSFEEGDVLVAKITPCLENGKGAHAVGLENGIGFGSTEFHVLRTKPGNSPRFVFHLTQWRRFRHLAEGQMVGSAGQLRVPRAFFDEFQITSLSAGHQVRIAQILDTLDTAIHETEAIIAKLKAVKQGLLHDLLTRGIDANGELRQPQAEAPHLYKASTLGWIPKAWATKSISDIADVKSGTTPSREKVDRYFSGHGAPWVKTLDLNEDVIWTTDEGVTAAALRETSCSLFPPGTVLVAMYGGWEQIGRTAMLAVPAATNQAISALVLKSGATVPEFVLRALQHGRTRWQGVAASTRKDPNITKSDVVEFEIPVPGPDEQSQIAQGIRASLNRLELETITLAALRRHKSGLMDDLLTGRVRVTPLLDATDE